jgi:hypothetical protein
MITSMLADIRANIGGHSAASTGASRITTNVSPNATPDPTVNHATFLVNVRWFVSPPGFDAGRVKRPFADVPADQHDGDQCQHDPSGGHHSRALAERDAMPPMKSLNP